MSDREDQEQQRRLRQDWDDDAAANLAYQQQQEEERDVNQYRRSVDREAVEGVAWVIGALIGLAFVVPVMAAVLVWKSVVWTVRWVVRKR